MRLQQTEVEPRKIFRPLGIRRCREDFFVFSGFIKLMQFTGHIKLNLKAYNQKEI